MTTWASSPVAEVLGLILSASAPGGVACREPSGDAEWIVFSYREDFALLWRMDDLLCDWLRKASRRIVVVWDGVPESEERSGVYISGYVTPFDWVVTLAWLLRKEPPDLRVLVVDLDSQHGSCFGRNAFATIRQVLPWVQFYRPVGRDGLALTSLETLGQVDVDAASFARPMVPLNDMGVECLLRDLGVHNAAGWPPMHSLREVNDNTSGYDFQLEMLQRLWVNNLTKAATRHDVGNLVAPLMLASAFPSEWGARTQIEQSSAARAALFRQAELLGVLQSDTSMAKRIPIGGLVGVPDLFPKDHDVFGRRQRVRFLLIDDRYDLGYHHLLGYLLFGNRYTPNENPASPWGSSGPDGHRLACEVAATSLFRRLKGCGDKCAPDCADRRTPIDDWDSPRELPLDADILLLDLRLWTEKNERQDFLRQAADLYESLGAASLKDARLDRAYGAAREACSDVKKLAARLASEGHEATSIAESEPALAALALFPLLLSHYDPTFPIIVFSSTQQRQVTELFADRANVITTFSKPIVSGYSTPRQASTSLDDLCRAIERALDLHESRIVWERICQLDAAPAFCFTYEKKDRAGLTVYVCNAVGEPDAGSRKDWSGCRFQREERAFPLQGDALRRAVAYLYERYVLRGNYFDSLAASCEFVEGLLTPSEAIEDYRWHNPRWGVPVGERWVPRRNHLIKALQLCRHRKAHGVEHHAGESDDQYRTIALLGFLILVDALSQLRARRPPLIKCLSRVRELVRADLRLKPTQIPWASQLVDSLLTWNVFAALAMAEAAADGYEVRGSEKCSYLSSSTLTALDRFVKQISAR